MRAGTSLWAPEPFEVPSFLPGFPGGSDSKESACNMGDPALISGPGRSPGEGTGNPLQYSCLGNPMDRGASPGKSHGQRSLEGYSPWGHRVGQLPHTHTNSSRHGSHACIQNMLLKLLSGQQRSDDFLKGPTVDLSAK